MPSLNKDLQSRLKEHFHPLGIVAYSNCCRFGCSGSYNEDDENLQGRNDEGVYFIRLRTDGMNYTPHQTMVAAKYVNFEYVVRYKMNTNMVVMIGW